jgi:hypothetical protein
MWKIVVLVSLFFHFNTCKAQQGNTSSHRTISPEAMVLYHNMQKLTAKGIMFGHQDDLVYGVGWKYDDGKSDVKLVTSDYPAVYGWDLGCIEIGAANSLDDVSFDKIRNYIKEVYKRGGVNAISWHARNPLTDSTAWDISSQNVVSSILPGGEKHELYKEWLDKLALFFQSLTNDEGKLIPVIFRPYHEQSGSWFWWGKNLCSREQYIQLWRFTVTYLSEVKKLNNILYAYSPTDGFRTETDYLDRYPGDEYVDFLGFDAYQDHSNSSAYINKVSKSLKTLCSVAKKRNKVPILAETGYERIPSANWWTEVLWKTIENHKIAYVLLWRNAFNRPNHYYVPYPGQASANNFIEFYNLPGTIFQTDVTKENLYK